MSAAQTHCGCGKPMPPKASEPGQVRRRNGAPYMCRACYVKSGRMAEIGKESWETRTDEQKARAAKDMSERRAAMSAQEHSAIAKLSAAARKANRAKAKFSKSAASNRARRR